MGTEDTMKKRKYAYMIVGCDRGLMIGMETRCGMKISRCMTWCDLLDTKVDVVEVNLDIMEQRLDDELGKPPTAFEEIFGQP
jgi:hypothetical protein